MPILLVFSLKAGPHPLSVATRIHAQRMEKRTLKRGFATSTIDFSRQFADLSNVPTTGNWWEDPPAPAPKETMSSAALRTFHKLRLKMKRSMSFGRSKDFDAEQKGDCDIFFKPPKSDPYYEDLENYDPLELSKEGIEHMKERLRRDTISRPMKLRKHPSKDLQALREKRSRERFRGVHPLPRRPGLRNMSTTPDLREKNKRDSGYINDLLPEFPTPPTLRPRPHAKSLIQELDAKRARMGSVSMSNLALAHSKAAANREGPSNVLWINRPVKKPVGVPPGPPLPPGAARPRFPSQPNASFKYSRSIPNDP